MPPTPEPDSTTLPERLKELAGVLAAVLGLAAVLLPGVSIKLVLGVLAVAALIYYIAKNSNLQTAGVTLVAVAAIIAAAYTLVVRPITLTGTLALADGSPVGGANLVLTDGDGVPHTIETREDGGFSVNNLPEGPYEVVKDEQVLYSGEVPGGWQRLLTLNVIRVGRLYVVLPTPEPTPIPTPTPPPTPVAESSAEWAAREIFPQAQGTGGQASTWNNPPGAISYALTPACARSGSFGLQLEYGYTEAGNGGWYVTWVPSPGGSFDASGFANLEFWVRGRAGGETFGVGLKDIEGQEIRVYVDQPELPIEVSSADWTLASIPLSTYAAGGVDLAALDNVSFGFSSGNAPGAVCIDDIAFTGGG
jgi:hypothetical protein